LTPNVKWENQGFCGVEGSVHGMLLGYLWLPRSKRRMVVKYASGASSQCPMDPMVAWETKDGEEWVLRLLYYLCIYGNTPPQSTVYKWIGEPMS